MKAQSLSLPFFGLLVILVSACGTGAAAQTGGPKASDPVPVTESSVASELPEASPLPTVPKILPEEISPPPAQEPPSGTALHGTPGDGAPPLAESDFWRLHGEHLNPYGEPGPWSPSDLEEWARGSSLVVLGTVSVADGPMGEYGPTTLVRVHVERTLPAGDPGGDVVLAWDRPGSYPWSEVARLDHSGRFVFFLGHATDRDVPAPASRFVCVTAIDCVVGAGPSADGLYNVVFPRESLPEVAGYPTVDALFAAVADLPIGADQKRPEN